MLVKHCSKQKQQSSLVPFQHTAGYSTHHQHKQALLSPHTWRFCCLLIWNCTSYYPYRLWQAHLHHRLTVPSYSTQGWLGNGTMIKEAFIVMPRHQPGTWGVCRTLPPFVRGTIFFCPLGRTETKGVFRSFCIFTIFRRESSTFEVLNVD